MVCIEFLRQQLSYRQFTLNLATLLMWFRVTCKCKLSENHINKRGSIKMLGVHLFYLIVTWKHNNGWGLKIRGHIWKSEAAIFKNKQFNWIQISFSIWVHMMNDKIKKLILMFEMKNFNLIWFSIWFSVQSVFILHYFPQWPF